MVYMVADRGNRFTCKRARKAARRPNSFFVEEAIAHASLKMLEKAMLVLSTHTIGACSQNGRRLEVAAEVATIMAVD